MIKRWRRQTVTLLQVIIMQHFVDEIRATVFFQRDIRRNILCFTETLLTRDMLSESMQPSGFFVQTEKNVSLVSGRVGVYEHTVTQVLLFT
jgi:hypothetical protein